MTAYSNNLEHLRDELRRLDILLRRAIAQMRTRRSGSGEAEFRGLFISDDEIDELMASAGDETAEARAETYSGVVALGSEIQRRALESRRAGALLRLDHLSLTFGLSPFESDLVLLALAPEIDLRYQKVYAYLHDDVNRNRPSVALALQLFCVTLDERMKAREAFEESSSLIANSLLSLCEDPTMRSTPLLSRFIKIDDRIAEFLCGSDHMDRRLIAGERMARWVKPEIGLHDLILPENIRALLENIASLAGPWRCVLHGPAGAGKKAAAEAICHALGRPLFVLDIPAFVMSGTSFQALLRAAFREALLYGSAIYLDGAHELLHEEAARLSGVRVVEQEIERLLVPIFIGSRSPWHPTGPTRSRFINVELPIPNGHLRRRLWEAHLDQGSAVCEGVDASYFAGAFRFTAGQIRQALTRAETHASLRQGERVRITSEDLLAGCRAQSTKHILSFARKIDTRRVWSDLVLPRDTIAQLREFCLQARYGVKVYDEWGFDQKLSLGKGLIALFTGSSGTGKTLSAEILANELGLDLYKVDLSCVVSKYIGETEKNLSRVFEDAQQSNAILFFDEADALFGKRSEVKDAHDRYANIEVNYLLQRVEEYEGVIILATNMSKNIDTAFLRRLHFCIEFPFPDEDHRFRIWRGIFPPQAPLADDIDFGFLSHKFKIAGGNIKNIALRAAFLAVEEGGMICMKHLILALKREYQKLGKICEKAEFEKYYDLVRR